MDTAYTTFAPLYDAMMHDVDYDRWAARLDALLRATLPQADGAAIADCACGTGALMFKHANSSGFWVTVSMSNMDVNQGIRAVGGGSTVAGFTGALVTCILYMLGII